MSLEKYIDKVELDESSESIIMYVCEAIDIHHPNYYESVYKRYGKKLHINTLLELASQQHNELNDQEIIALAMIYQLMIGNRTSNVDFPSLVVQLGNILSKFGFKIDNDSLDRV